MRSHHSGPQSAVKGRLPIYRGQIRDLVDLSPSPSRVYDLAPFS